MIYDPIVQGCGDGGHFLRSEYRKGQTQCPQQVWSVAARKLDQLDSVVDIDELRVPPGNRLEHLRGERAGQYSIRINDQYRICFVWTEVGPGEVEITDYH